MNTNQHGVFGGKPPKHVPFDVLRESHSHPRIQITAWEARIKMDNVLETSGGASLPNPPCLPQRGEDFS